MEESIMCSDKIMEYFITFFIAFSGIFFGAILTYWYSKKLFYESSQNSALDEFIKAFTDTKLFIENYTPNTKDLSGDSISIYPTGKIGFCESLLSFRGTHQRAIEVFSHCISKEKYDKIKKAYENYYNPRNEKGSPEMIHLMSFSVYNWTKKWIKKEFKKDIIGKELAFENINKILDAARE
jgi:hypothetical protein